MMMFIHFAPRLLHREISVTPLGVKKDSKSWRFRIETIDDMNDEDVHSIWSSIIASRNFSDAPSGVNTKKKKKRKTKNSKVFAFQN